jgi:hypothetical protein
MTIEELHEPIRVLADCSAGRIEPLRFEWSGRTFRVEAVNGRWLDRRADGYCLHYSVQSGEETYYLHFASGEVQWWLDRLVTAG